MQNCRRDDDLLLNSNSIIKMMFFCFLFRSFIKICCFSFLLGHTIEAHFGVLYCAVNTILWQFLDSDHTLVKCDDTSKVGNVWMNTNEMRVIKNIVFPVNFLTVKIKKSNA